eukprot:GHVR01056681.1.p1 GENE.GHVR01056681.1~~GHVR01056681.1.p1  ORF type:complete len:155 (+),score=7.09 GHVR01056681.1:136-600(+)
MTATDVTSNNTPPSAPAVRSINSFTDSVLPFSLYSDNTGTKACENAPSANKRRKKLGILKATKKQSALLLAPKKIAITTSRIKPNTRDNSVITLTNKLERNKPRCFTGFTTASLTPATAAAARRGVGVATASQLCCAHYLFCQRRASSSRQQRK